MTISASFKSPRRVAAFVALTAAVVLAAVFFSSRRGSPPVVILLLDTTRADHLGAYGYERATSPELDRFAAENMKFNFAVSAAPWTPPSVASILSGMYPASHGLMPPSRRQEARAQSKVDNRIKFLGEVLKERGYATAAVSPNPWITADFNFTKGFDTFEYSPRAPADKINEAAFRLVKKFKEDKTPFFLYLHYLDPHWPYEPPEGYAGLFTGKVNVLNYDQRMLTRLNAYDGEIKFLDAQLGRLFEFFKAEGVYDEMILVIVGDHGEQFMERGFTEHGNVVYNVESHVPLLLKAGARGPKGKIVDHTVSTIDIFPTVLELVGIEKPAQAALAVSLLDDYSKTRPGVLSEITRKLSQRAFVTLDGEKLIVGGTKRQHKPSLDDPAQNVVGIFQSRKDPFEEKPIENPPRKTELENGYRELTKLAAQLRLPEQTGSGDVSEETLEQLRSLGYLD